MEPLGDRAYLLRDLSAPAYLVAEALNQRPLNGLVEAVASYDTVGIYVLPDFDPACLIDLEPGEAAQPRHHQIPVWYDGGEDFVATCDTLRLSSEELISLHSSHHYHCAAIGFCPGFPYLASLPPRIAGLPRKSSPRSRVPPGSVGITGDQTGIYPLPTPGGWNLIGLTPLTLVDPADRYFPIVAGDLLSFTPIDQDEYNRLKGQRL